YAASGYPTTSTVYSMPIPSGRGRASAGVETSCTPRPGIVRTTLKVQTSSGDSRLVVSSMSGIAASISQKFVSLLQATNQRGFQLTSPQQSSHTQPRWSTCKLNVVV